MWSFGLKIYRRWALASHKGNDMPNQWPFEWVTGLIAPISGVRIPCLKIYPVLKVIRLYMRIWDRVMLDLLASPLLQLFYSNCDLNWFCQSFTPTHTKKNKQWFWVRDLDKLPQQNNIPRKSKKYSCKKWGVFHVIFRRTLFLQN